MKNIFKKFKKDNDVNNERYIGGNSIPTVERADEIYIGGKPEEQPKLLSIEELEIELYKIFIKYLTNPTKLTFNISNIKSNITYSTKPINLDYLSDFIYVNFGNKARATVKYTNMMLKGSGNCYFIHINLDFDNIDTTVWYNYFRYCNNISDKEKLSMVVSYSSYIKDNIDSVLYNKFITDNKSKLNTLTSIIIDSIADTSSGRSVKNLITLSFRNNEEKILLENLILSNNDYINRFYADYNIKIEIIFGSICVNICNLTQKEIN